MNIPQLKIFAAVAECQNYSRAAQRLYLSQPHVYVQMRNMEKEVGCALFDKVGKRAVLTEVGRDLLEYAQRILDLEQAAHRMVDDYKRLNTGTLTVLAGSVVADYFLPGVMAAFKHRFPNVELRMKIFVGGVDTSEQVLRFELDLVFFGERTQAPYTMVERILRSELVPCVGPGHRLASKKEVTVADLVDEPFVWYGYQSNTRRLGEEALTTLGLVPASAMILESPEAVKGVVMGNYGVALLPHLMVREELRTERLCALPVQDFSGRYSIFCHRHRARTLSPAAEAFLQIAKETATAISAEESRV